VSRHTRWPTSHQDDNTGEQDNTGQEDSFRGLRKAFASLTYRDFRFFWIGGLVSGTGRFFQVVTLPVVIWDLTEDPGWVGLTGFAQFLPMALMAPIAGPLADRYPRRKMLLVTQSLMSVVAIALAFMWWGGVRSPHAYAVVALLSGIAGGMNLPAWQAFVSELVPRRLLLNAVTLNSAQFNSSRMVGPVLAGLTVATAGPGAAFAVNAFTYLAVIAALLLIEAPGTPRSDPRRLQPVRNLFETARYALGRPGIGTAIGLVAVMGFFGLSVQVLSVVFAEDVFHRGATGYGLMLTMLGVGAVVSAPFVASLGGRVRRSKIQGVALAVYGVAMTGLATAPVFWMALISLVVMGAAHLATASTLNTTVQLQVDEARRAQVLGLYLMSLMLAAPLGQLGLGQMIEVIGPRVTFAASGAVLLAAAVWLVATRRLRRLDVEFGAYEPQVSPEVHPTVPAPPSRLA